MAKQRFRDIKQGKTTHKEEPKQTPLYTYASLSAKIKAFLTDSFMLMMPIMYMVVYLVMEGREGFQSHMLMGWVAIFIPLVIVQTLFMTKTGQTPGYRAYNLEIIEMQTGKRPSAFVILFRNILAILSFFSFFGWLMMFFRKDAKTLHDLLSATAIIKKP